ncbi:MAG: hypothetical protein RLY14_3109, partial [Planctomycetota bacterium]
MSVGEGRAIAESIKRLLKDDPLIFIHGPSKFKYFLNDLIPELRTERFLVCSALEYPRFLSSLANGRCTRDDISHVEFFLSDKLGFKDTYAKWVAEIWLTAFGFTAPTPRSQINCLHCQATGEPNIDWKDNNVTCTSCNAEMHISSSLKPSLIKPGWPKRRIRNKSWVVNKSPQLTRISSLRHAIRDAIANDELTTKEISQHIGLENIVSALHEEIALLLNANLRLAGPTEEILVKSVLASVFSDNGIKHKLDDHLELGFS